MKYRVLDGPPLRWPNGAIRAEAGDVFEAHDGHENPEVRRKARVYLRGSRGRIVPVPEESVTATVIPDEYFEELREAAAEPRREPKKRTTSRMSGVVTKGAEKKD